MTQGDSSLKFWERSASFWKEFCMLLLLLLWENELRLQFEKQQKLPRVPQGRDLPEDATYLLLKGEHGEGSKGLRLEKRKKKNNYQVSVRWNQEGHRGRNKTLLWFIYFFSPAAVFQKIAQPEWKQESRIVWSAAWWFGGNWEMLFIKTN